MNEGLVEWVPQGRSMRELHKIVAKSNARYDRIGSVWNDLTDAEQETLAALAESMAQDDSRL